jgi:hypothetical protein
MITPLLLLSRYLCTLLSSSKCTRSSIPAGPAARPHDAACSSSLKRRALAVYEKPDDSHRNPDRLAMISEANRIEDPNALSPRTYVTVTFLPLLPPAYSCCRSACLTDMDNLVLTLLLVAHVAGVGVAVVA